MLPEKEKHIAANIEHWKQLVNTRLEQLLPSPSPPEEILHEAMRYACLGGGKRIRPMLCMASAESVGADPISVLDAACAIEIIHCFSLVHDDLPAIDDDRLRRGKPTSHILFGEAVALLSGDALLSHAFDVLSHMQHDTPLNLLWAIRELSRAIGYQGLVGGETLDVLSEGKNIDQDLLMSIHSRKTGSLMSISCVLGGILGQGSKSDIEVLRSIGDALGLAFQIKDDILNETSQPDTLGKACGTDIKKKKITFPSVYGLENSEKACLTSLKYAEKNMQGLAGNTDTLYYLSHKCVHRSY